MTVSSEAAPAAALSQFSEPTRTWFAGAFAQPTAAQVGAWSATARGASVLVSAPTGSGKTLAAFLAAVDRLATTPPRARGAPPAGGTRVVYVSPLKALAYDVDRNLRAPLAGIRRTAERLGSDPVTVSVGLRTGDTPADERRRLARTPPDILITTPESLYLLLTSRARATLTGVETVIVDEVHAVAGTKRGAHLALTLERLEALRRAADPDCPPLQRIGLSATQRPVEVVAEFLAGGVVGPDGAWRPRPVEVVDVGSGTDLDVEIVVPVEDMSRLGELLPEPPSGPAAAGGEARRSIWPAVHPRILELVRAHRSTIVFANSRRLAERLCARLNELGADTDDADGAAPPVARAHHGSVSREERSGIEEALKAGRLPCVVATSSLELGIDMGAVDLVIQVESPGSVASGLQRIGRAGHHVGAPSVGKVFPKYRGDLLECAVVVRRMLDGAIEPTRPPRTPLDVLAQQVVAMTAMEPWDVDALWRTVRGAANFAELSRPQLDGLLDMLSGRYPSDEFAELRPRLTWDRVADRVSGRPAAQRLAVTSGGTIPDRGLYGVFLADGGQRRGGPGGGRASGYRRVGELDEEMVYETRPGETFTLGASTWRIVEITRDQVLVTPAPGEPGKLPFWHGDAPGRPVEVGRALGRFSRELSDLPEDAALQRLRADYGLDPLAAANLVGYLCDQRQATGVVPSDRTLVVERFRDEIGDWRVCLLSPFGARVHAPWALAIETRVRERLGVQVQSLYADDGIVVRLPDREVDDDLLDALLPDPDEVEDLVVGALSGSALFAARFRECAARALLLPRRRPGGRTPLWQQRQRAADLLAVASRYGSFPVLLETYRECLRDVFDVPALTQVLRDVDSRRVRVVQVETPAASPFASSLLFDYVASYMYEGDAPLAERRASALSLDRELLAELVGAEELRELVDPDALAALELELARLAPQRRARSADDVHDLLREVGDLRSDEVADRTDAPAATVEAWLAALEAQRRAYRLRVAGQERWAAAEDAARFRDGLGVPPPAGLPEAFTRPVERPLVDLVARYARTHGPFQLEHVAARLALPSDAVALALAELAREGRVVSGGFRPGGGARDWCDAGVLRRLRRRSLAALRSEVEPVEQAVLARFLPAWQGVDAAATGVDRVYEVVEQLQGAPVPASIVEGDVLAARVRGYSPAWLDELCATGEVCWLGLGPLGGDDGRVALYLRDQVEVLAGGVVLPDRLGAARDQPWWSRRHERLVEHLGHNGASFWPQLYAAAGGGAETEVVEALWDLVWAGLVTNDTVAPLRALRGPAPAARAGRRRRPGRVTARAGPPRAAGRWSLAGSLTGAAGGPAATRQAVAVATQLLERHGVVTRDAVAAEELSGGFSAAYRVLGALEESGRCRRGYFVEGLGGAQFALPGAVDRLRSLRDAGASPEGSGAVLLAAADPANPYGAALAWPQPRSVAARHRPRRAAGAYVVLLGGRLAAYLERGGRSLLTFTTDEDQLAAAVAGLVELVSRRRLRAIRLQRIDGAELQDADGTVVAVLRAAGFADHPRGLVLR